MICFCCSSTPAGARRHGPLVNDDDVGPAPLHEVVGHRVTDHACPRDHHLGMRGQRGLGVGGTVMCSVLVFMENETVKTVIYAIHYTLISYCHCQIQSYLGQIRSYLGQNWLYQGLILTYLGKITTNSFIFRNFFWTNPVIFRTKLVIKD